MQLSGEIAKIDLPNLLQLVKTGGFTGKITLVQGVKHAIVLVKDGLPVHAELENESGTEVLLAIFLWSQGTFAYNEEEVEESQRTIPEESAGFNLSDFIKDGILYKKQKALLDELNIQPSTILKPTGTGLSGAKIMEGSSYIEHLDGKRTLKEALSSENLSHREYVGAVAQWLENGLAEFVETPSSQGENINLPTWVVARLLQDNVDITQSIIDMVIWVDRVKCWMYQADAEFNETRKELALIAESLDGNGASSDSHSTDTDSLFAPPAPPPDENEPEAEPEPKEEKPIPKPKFDTIFNSPTSRPIGSTYGQFRLSSSFIGGAGGNLSFLQDHNSASGGTLDNLGSTKFGDHKRVENPQEDKED